MKILDYVKKLIPGMARSQVLDDIATARKIISEILIPGWESVDAQFGSGYKAPENKALVDKISAHLRGKIKGALAKATIGVLNGLLETLSYLESTVVESFDDEIARDGLTYRKATILRWVDLVIFMTDYSRALLRHIVGMEDHHALGHEHDITPGDVRYLEKNLAVYAGVLAVAAEGRKAFTKALDEIPEILVDEENDAVVKSTLGASRSDALQLGFLSPSTSPIYWFRMQAANRAVARYQSALEEKRMLELKVLRMKENHKPGANPALDKQIAYQEARIARLNNEIRTWEERHG
jgi:hypothetical protein